MNVSPDCTGPLPPDQHGQEILSIIAFSRGVLLGFVSAFATFDLGIAGGAATQALIGAARYAAREALALVL